MNRVSHVSLIHQHTNLTERLSSSVLTKINFSKPGTQMNFQNSNKSLLVSAIGRCSCNRTGVYGCTR